VSLRSLDDWEMGNKVCTVWLYFPVSEADPVARLRIVHERMNRLKSLPAATIQYFNTRVRDSSLAGARPYDFANHISSHARSCAQLLGAIPGLLNNPLVLRHFKWYAALLPCVGEIRCQASS
jgi:hypothetical protein